MLNFLLSSLLPHAVHASARRAEEMANDGLRYSGDAVQARILHGHDFAASVANGLATHAVGYAGQAAGAAQGLATHAIGYAGQAAGAAQGLATHAVGYAGQAAAAAQGLGATAASGIASGAAHAGSALATAGSTLSSGLAAGGAALAGAASTTLATVSTAGAALGAVALPVAVVAAAGYGAYSLMNRDKFASIKKYDAEVQAHRIPLPAMIRTDQTTVLSREIKSDRSYLEFLKAKYPKDKASMTVVVKDLQQSQELLDQINTYPAQDESVSRNRAVEFAEDMTSV